MMSEGVLWSLQTWCSRSSAVSCVEISSVVGMTWAILENLSTTTRIASMASSSGSPVMKSKGIESEILRRAGKGSSSPSVFNHEGLVY